MEPGPSESCTQSPRAFLTRTRKVAWKASSRVVRVGQDAPADAQDHRPVPLDQGREGQLGRLAPAGREPLQELPVRQLPDGSDVHQRADLAQDRAILPSRHPLSFRLGRSIRRHRE